MTITQLPVRLHTSFRFSTAALQLWCSSRHYVRRFASAGLAGHPAPPSATQRHPAPASTSAAGTAYTTTTKNAPALAAIISNIPSHCNYTCIKRSLDCGGGGEGAWACSGRRFQEPVPVTGYR